jgi:hypothetical protein
MGALSLARLCHQDPAVEIFIEISGFMPSRTGDLGNGFATHSPSEGFFHTWVTSPSAGISSVPAALPPAGFSPVPAASFPAGRFPNDCLVAEAIPQLVILAKAFSPTIIPHSAYGLRGLRDGGIMVFSS